MPKKVLVAEGDSWFALSEYKPWFIRIFSGIKRTDGGIFKS